MCPEAQARLGDTWDEQTRERGRAAFVEAAPGYGDDAWASVAATVDDRVKRWSEEYRYTCEDTASAERFSVRTLCLEGQLDELRQFTGLAVYADEHLVRNAVAMANNLREPSECRDAEDPHHAVDPQRRDLLRELERDHRRARMLRGAGKWVEAKEAAADVAQRAAEADAFELLARAQLLRCRVAGMERRFTDAEELCHDALRAAERAGSDRSAASALIRLAENVDREHRGSAVDWLYRLAKDRIDALPAEDRTPQIASWWAGSRGLFEKDRGNSDEALRLLEEALTVLEQAEGEDHIDLLSPLNNLGIVSHHVGRLAQAERYLRRAVEIATASYGPNHPQLGLLLTNLGGALADAGRVEEAVEVLQRSLELKRASLGADSPLLATSHLELARALIVVGEHARAEEHAVEGGRLHGAGYGEDSDAVAVSLAVRAEALLGLGRCDETLPRLRELQEVVAGRKDRSLFSMGDIPLAVGHCLEAQGDGTGAAAAFVQALQYDERNFGPDHRILVRSLLEIGSREALLRAQTIVRATEGDPGEAVAIERALNALERGADG